MFGWRATKTVRFWKMIFSDVFVSGALFRPCFLQITWRGVTCLGNIMNFDVCNYNFCFLFGAGVISSQPQAVEGLEKISSHSDFDMITSCSGETILLKSIWFFRIMDIYKSQFTSSEVRTYINHNLHPKSLWKFCEVEIGWQFLRKMISWIAMGFSPWGPLGQLWIVSFAFGGLVAFLFEPLSIQGSYTKAFGIIPDFESKCIMLVLVTQCPGYQISSWNKQQS